MTRTEQRNRASKAIAIADTLQVVHCDSETATALTPEGWRQAAQAAAARTGHTWADASPATQAAVVAILADRESKALAPVGTATVIATSAPVEVLAAMVTALIEADGGWEPDPEPEPSDPHEDAYIGWCEANDVDPADPQARSLYTDHLDANDLEHLR